MGRQAHAGSANAAAAVDFHADTARMKLGAAIRIEATIKVAVQRIIHA